MTPQDLMSLEGKLTLVTGAGVGIGQGVALELGRRGADVVLHYASNAQGAEEAAEQIRAMGRRAQVVQGDLSKVSECRRVVDDAVKFLGGLDVLVNNAGVSTTVEFLKTTEDQFDLTFDLNIRGQYFCAQQAVPHMVERGRDLTRRYPDMPWRGGSIINMSSIQGLGGLALHTAYAGTKGAIIAFTRTMAIEICPLRIRANVIAPGAVEVPRYWDNIENYSRELGNTMAPWGRVGLPEDIGYMAAFLSSDAAEWITGQVFTVDGGTMARLPIGVTYH